VNWIRWQSLSNVLNHIPRNLSDWWYRVGPIFAALAEARHIQKQAEFERNKIRINKGVDAKLRCPQGGLSLSCVFEAKPIFLSLGLLFDVSKTSANDAFNYWVDILRDILPASVMEEVQGREKYEELQNCSYQLIVDSAEQPTARVSIYLVLNTDNFAEISSESNWAKC